MGAPVRGKRRKTSGRFLMLPAAVMQSAAFRSLSHAQVRVLILLASDYDGQNNGSLALTRPQAHAQGIGSNATLDVGLVVLEQRGLIIRTDPGMLRPPRPARFAVTWKDMDKTEFSPRRAAGNDYRNWKGAPSKNKSEAHTVGPDGHTDSAQGAAWH